MADTVFGIMTDYDYNAEHKRKRISVWTGPFMSVWIATGYSLPKNNGFMLTDYNDKKIRVECETDRREDNFQVIDKAISDALNVFYAD